MGASKERVVTFESVDFDEIEQDINKFITDNVSQVVDLHINTNNEVYEEWDEGKIRYIDRQRTTHYAYLRYLPQ